MRNEDQDTGNMIASFRKFLVVILLLLLILILLFMAIPYILFLACEYNHSKQERRY